MMACPLFCAGAPSRHRCAWLAVSRLLADPWSMTLLSSELAVLARHGRLAPLTQPTYIDTAAQHSAPVGDKEPPAVVKAMGRHGSLMAPAGLVGGRSGCSTSSAQQDDDERACITLPPDVARAAATRGWPLPALLLAAFAKALGEGSAAGSQVNAPAIEVMVQRPDNGQSRNGKGTDGTASYIHSDSGPRPSLGLCLPSLTLPPSMACDRARSW